MSQSGSESDIWEYKSLRNTKRHDDSQNAKGTRRGKGKRKHELGTEQSSNKNKRVSTTKAGCCVKNRTSAKTQPRNFSIQMKDVNGGLSNQPPPSDKACEGKPVAETQKPSPPKGYCPVCQMPFSILVVQSQRWHVAECLETPGNDSKECPEGIQCSSTIPSHYKKYSHFLLAHSRSVNDDSELVLSQEISADHRTTSSPPLNNQNNDIHSGTLDSLEFNKVSASSSSNPSASLSPLPAGPTQPSSQSRSNALLLLRSPALDDIKKKKGWSPSGKGTKPPSLTKAKVSPQVRLDPDKDNSVYDNQVNMDLKSDAVSSTPPLEPVSLDQTAQLDAIKEEESSHFIDDDDYISFSPLSEMPNNNEGHRDQHRRELFPKEESNDSLQLSCSEAAASDSDDLFSELMDQCDLEQLEDGPLVKDSFDSTYMELTSSSLVQDQMTTPGSTGVPELPHQHNFPVPHSEIDDKTSLQSPQSLVLERLRERVSSQVFHTGIEENSCSQLNQGVSQQPLSQTSSQLNSTTMAPRKTQSKAGATSSGFKQTDIGVFFGLKPKLKDPEKKTVGVSGNTHPVRDSQQTSEAPASHAGRSGWRRRKDPEVGPGGATENGEAQPGQAKGGRRQGGWSRWNRKGEDGQERARPCPFYKKIPGTPFVVDAFQYGSIEGITAYFLTHFHSDHYGGLTKNSTVPIYCNKITGNLVKSKLRVDDQYIHILPMNTECTVEGVKVILLDANHCPGSAMLLFTLPTGQKVLHTGDFRADPSMERYPELQGFRVQTLYLDTTYCSPEYTFPTQQEVITFAANRAFEAVTLSPRTLVVCGTYSVGKEKVFLAVADVLGCKVCLSRDKYNTMCCLESDQIRQSITTDGKAAQVHVLPMMQLNFKNLQTYLKRFSDKYDQLIAFKPTGWTFNQGSALEHLQPQTQGNITIYGIPYSEHSGYLELKRFVQWLRPQKIIPTVNVGSWRSRKAMEQCFSEWDAEVGTHLKRLQ
ncbi:DNA cross-link repair 1A protein [Alosa pseudoharengus]|uniref:DNA cross-link repair 1A protein n=1 Tax=Alosa pseudoharengus TaxID=34774 RepID=UPI003F89B6E4